MISTILNELSVQIVSDPFPKPKQLSNLIRFHQCQSPCTNQFQVKSNNYFVPSLFRFQSPCTKQIQIQQAFCSFLSIQACLQANTNTSKSNRHFVPSFSSQACLQANTKQITNADTKQIKATTKNNRQQAEGIRRTSGPSNGPHSPCPPTIFQQSSNLQKLLHQNNSLSLLST